MSGVFVGVRLAVHGRVVSPLPSKPRLLRAIRASSALRKGEELGVCVCIHICIYTGCLLFLRLPYPLHSFSYTRSKPPSSTPSVSISLSLPPPRATWPQRGPPRANLPSCIIPTGYFQYLMLLRSCSRPGEEEGRRTNGVERCLRVGATRDKYVPPRLRFHEGPTTEILESVVHPICTNNRVTGLGYTPPTGGSLSSRRVIGHCRPTANTHRPPPPPPLPPPCIRRLEKKHLASHEVTRLDGHLLCLLCRCYVDI